MTMTGQIIELPAIDDDGHLDHADLEPTDEEAAEGRRQGQEIDPDDVEDGGEPE
jgi:hypothetical protein